MQATIGYAQHAFLLLTYSTELKMAVLQNTYFQAYFSKRHEGSGPSLLQLKQYSLDELKLHCTQNN